MAKISPASIKELDVKKSAGLTDFIEDMKGLITDDLTNRSSWERTKTEGISRRFCQLFRNPTFPWPDSSDIVLPFIDMMIKRVKSSYVALHKQSPPATFMAQTPDQFESARTAEWYLDYLINFSTNDFRRQAHIGADNIVTYGLGVYKIVWEFVTRNVKEVIEFKDLPEKIRQILPNSILLAASGAVVGSEEEANRRASEDGDLTVTEEEIREIARKQIALAYQLDPDEEGEAAAINEILSVLDGSKAKVVIRKRDIVRNAPKMISVDPLDIFVPIATTSIEEASRITHRMFYDETSLMNKVRDSEWDKKAVMEAIDQRRGLDVARDGENVKREVRRTYQTADSELIEIWEVYCNYDLDGDGFDERVVITMDANADIVFKIQELPYDHGEWPFVGIPFEAWDNNYFSSRGLPEILDDIDAEITATERFKINSMAINAVPVLKYRLGSHFNPQGIAFSPGSSIPVQNMQDVEPLAMPQTFQVHQQQENVLRAFAEQYVGSNDFGISSPGAAIGEARTAREISAIAANKEDALGLNQDLYLQGYKRIFQQIWALVQQFGPQDIVARTLGGKILSATKEDIQGRFDITPNAPAGAFDPGLRLAQSVSFLQMFAQAMPVLENSTTHSANLAQAFIDTMEQQDVRAARRYFTELTPEESQAKQQQLQGQAQLGLQQQQADIQSKQADAASKQAAAAAKLAPLQQQQAEQQAPGLF